VLKMCLVCIQVYRNAECARCNRVTSADCYDERTPKIDVDDLRRELFGPSLALVLVIDLNAGTAEVHGSVPRRRQGVDPSPPVAAVSLAPCRPGEVYDPYDDSCRPVGCSFDGSAAFGSNAVCPSTPTPMYVLICFAKLWCLLVPPRRRLCDSVGLSDILSLILSLCVCSISAKVISRFH